MNVEKELGFLSSFNFVARGYRDNPELRAELATNGFEVGVHGLHHTGLMFASKSVFRLHAYFINRYLKKWDAVGYRSPAMWHNLKWNHYLRILYDASTFDTDPFEPQPESIQSIFPLWIQGNASGPGYVELPYTLPQDFTLFVMLQEKSIDIWKRKLDWIAERGGMALAITHPDYMHWQGRKRRIDEYPVEYYLQLLEYIRTQYGRCYWHALPRDMAQFWSQTQNPRESLYHT